MRYTVNIQEFNSVGKTVRNVSLIKTNKYDRAVSYFHQKVENLSNFGKAGRLVILDGEIIRKKYDY